MDVIVVGAGFGGLSAACHLVGAGHDVVVFDRSVRPGGVAQDHTGAGFRVDAGPAVITMPEVIDATFAAAGCRREDFIDLLPVDPIYRATFADGSSIRVRARVEDQEEEIHRLAGAAGVRSWRRFRAWLVELHRVEWPAYVDRNWTSGLDLVTGLRPGVRVAAMGGFRSYHHAVKRFFDDQRLQQLFSFQAGFVGGSPFATRAIYAMVTYCDTVAGVVHPRGGAHGLALQLARAATSAGCEFRLGAGVDAVLRRPDGRVRGVVLDSGEEIAADAVVINVPLAAAYETVLRGLSPPAALRRARYSPSCLVWMAGVRGRAPLDAAHHNMHFGPRWRSGLRAVRAGRAPRNDTSLFVSIPSLTEPDAATDGIFGFSALQAVPNTAGRLDWTRERAAMRRRLRDAVQRHGYPVDAVEEWWSDPLTWLEAGLPHGTPFSVSPQFSQSAALRPRNTDPRVPGLSFAGSGTVPGVGVPMVLISGRLAAERITSSAADRVAVR